MSTAEFDPELWPDGWDEEPADEQAAPSIEEFWASRRILTHIHDFARARRVAPWAVFGGVLTRVVTATKPFVQLPPTIGSFASLNLFVGLVGASGAGKDAAVKVGRDAVERADGFPIVPLGSGEGLSHMFMKEGDKAAEQYNDAALVTVGEVDSLTALVKRQASTVMAQLRQAAMGEQLGFFYVDSAKRMIVPEHAYRLCLIVNIQPERAGGLLDDAAGGTPQRFVWLPATDPGAPIEAPAEPVPFQWMPPDWSKVPGVRRGGMDRIPMRICQQAIDLIVQTRLDRLHGKGDALDGHALLTRLKVAAALALLEGYPEVRDEDWKLSGAVMSLSDSTRAGVQKVLESVSRDHNHRQAEAEASRTIVVQERLEEAKVRRVAGVIRRHMARTGGWIAHAKLVGCVASRDRDFAESALSVLVMAGQVEERKIDHNGQPGTQYRLEGDHQ